jgi:putative endopeptidase
MKKATFFVAAAIAVVVCVASDAIQEEKVPGLDVNNLDRSVKPTDNFFQFVNGNWVKNNPVPSDESTWNVFSELYEKNYHRLHTILNEAAADKSALPGSNTQKIRDFYSLGMDSVKRNKDGITPILPEFARIEKIATTTDLVKEIAHFHTIGVGTVFGLTVDQDAKISTQYITQVFQGGIGLGDKDYYTKTDERTLGIQKAYVEHIENMFKLLGDKPEVAKKNATAVYDLETKLAQASMDQIQLRDLQSQYNKKTIPELAQLTPDFQWDVYFSTAGIKGIDKVIVGQPEFFKELNKDMKSVPIADWKIYLRWSLVHDLANSLSDDFVNENFNFYSKTLYGIPSMRARWKRVLTAADAYLGDALGQLYVKKYFSEDSKKRINTMVDHLIAAYRVRIASRDWMSEETKKQANLKLDKLVRKMGYPDTWKNYSTLDIKNDSYVQNVLRASTYAYNETIKRIGKPIDRGYWFITAPTINAFYGASINEIVFPAGIMQPVFFNPDADDAVNYGSMGAVIGHELTHGFDDQGSQFDSDGNLKNWWTKEDLERFKAKTAKLSKQFDQYIAIDDIHVKGELTLGENIADLGGLTIAYLAYKKSLEGKPAPAKIDGFTGEQRFFMAWAQAWRINSRPEFLKNMIQIDPHAPSHIRANAAPSNMQEFYDAFGVKEGDKMYRPKEDRVEVW